MNIQIDKHLVNNNIYSYCANHKLILKIMKFIRQLKNKILINLINKLYLQLMVNYFLLLGEGFGGK